MVDLQLYIVMSVCLLRNEAYALLTWCVVFHFLYLMGNIDFLQVLLSKVL